VDGGEAFGGGVNWGGGGGGGGSPGGGGGRGGGRFRPVLLGGRGGGAKLNFKVTCYSSTYGLSHTLTVVNNCRGSRLVFQGLIDV